METYKALIILFILLIASCSSTPRNEGKSEQETIKNEAKAVEEPKAVNFSSEAGKTEHLSLEIKSITYTSSFMVMTYSIKNISDEDIWICVKSNAAKGDSPSRLDYEADLFDDKVEISIKQPYITEYLEAPIYSKFKKIPKGETDHFRLEIFFPIVQLTTKTGSYTSDDGKMVSYVNSIRQISFSVQYFQSYPTMLKCTTYGEQKHCNMEQIGENEVLVTHLWGGENRIKMVSTDIVFLNEIK